MLQYIFFMTAVLLLLAFMASPATTTTVTNSANAMSANQSSNADTVRAAQTRHNRIFGAYVLILVLTVLGTYLVWNSGNKVQEAIQADARARIEEAKQGVKQLEQNNLKLSGDLEKEKAKVAGLQRDVADANRRYEVERKARLLIEQRMADRDIRPDQREKMLLVLRTRAPGHVVIQSLNSEGREGLQYALKIAEVFHAAGWDVTDPNGMGAFFSPAVGVILIPGPNADDLTNFISDVLIAGEISPRHVQRTVPDARKAPGTVEIWVASK